MLRKVEKEQLKVPAHIDYLGDLRDFVTQVGKKHGFEDKLINAFKLSVDEAATNIMRHAYRETEGIITIRAIVKKNSLTISIIDQGTYFDPQRVKDPDLNRYIDIGKKGGLGIFIMRKLMDEIDYRRTDEGNELRITKYRQAPQKKKFARAVSSIPLSIKAKIFFRTVAIITLIIAGGYLYYFQKADDIILSNFVSTARITNNQIVNRISSAPAEGFDNEFTVSLIIDPIYDDYKGQIYKLALEDSNGGVIYIDAAGVNGASEFNRPKDSEKIDPCIFKYKLANDSTFYEFENSVLIKETGKHYGKSHILIVAENTEQEIATNRLNDLKLAFIILGISYVGVALLIYLVLNPLHKLSEWIKDLGHGEINDEIDIDASSEFGEIAQAFSDITHKFRQSQKNLVDQERLQREMQVAQDIQQTLLPIDFPVLDGYEVDCHYEAAKEVGGDYYDFVEVDKDTLGIVVADVSGKGVPGALLMTMIRTALRTEARGLKDAAEVLARVNDFVMDDIKKGMFVTVFYLIIDSKKRQINYASAGHNPMILYRESTEKTYYLNPKGFPIGIQLPQKDFFRKSIESETIQLTKDDILLVYTDGITEAMNSRRELFGEERLLNTLRTNGHLEVTDFVEKLKLAIYSFTQGTQQNDDISFVSIKEKSTREEDELRRAKEAHNLIAEGKSTREACEMVNLTTNVYYAKYKKVFEEHGTDAFAIDEEVSVEAKHFSIEETTKILDIISKHPEYGAGRIRDELKTEAYNLTELSESKIYEELVRRKLNTRQLREAYINKTKRSSRKLKLPGTPMMTLDGKIIISRKEESEDSVETPALTRGDEPPEPDDTTHEFEELIDEESDFTFETQEPSVLEQDEVQQSLDTNVESDIEAESFFGAIDEILAKEPMDDQESSLITEELGQNELTDEMGFDEPDTLETHASINELFSESNLAQSDSEFENEESVTEQEEASTQDSTFMEDISFSDLFYESTDLPEDDFYDESEEDKIAEVNTETKEESSNDSLISPTNDAIQNIDEKDNQEAFEEIIYDANDDVLISSYIDNIVDENQPDTSIIDEESNVEDTVSFSDLIQAIDEEIVFVPESSGNNLTKDSNGTEEPDDSGEIDEFDKFQISSNFEQDLEKTQGSEKSITNTVKRSHNVTKKEKKLIKGIRFYKNKEYEKAIQEFKKVIEIYPDYKEAYSILGNAYFRNQMYDEAGLAYKLVKQIDPEDIAAHENMGVIYANRGEYKLAIGEWKKVLELNPERTDIEKKIKKALRMK